MGTREEWNYIDSGRNCKEKTVYFPSSIQTSILFPTVETKSRERHIATRENPTASHEILVGTNYLQ